MNSTSVIPRSVRLGRPISASAATLDTKYCSPTLSSWCGRGLMESDGVGELSSLAPGGIFKGGRGTVPLPRPTTITGTRTVELVHRQHSPPSIAFSPVAKRLKTASDMPSPEQQNPPPEMSSSSSSSTTTTTTTTTDLDQSPPLLVKKLSENAQTPRRGSAFAAGYDLYRYLFCFLGLISGWNELVITGLGTKVG